MELSNAINRLQLSHLSLDDSWDGRSFEEESLSGGESDEQQELFRRNQTRDCIDGVLAILSNPTDASRPTDFSPSTKLPLQFAVSAFDQPPVRPRRSFDGGFEDLARRSKSEIIRDRFQLSRSEHISRSFRAPRRPSRGFENTMMIDDQERPETSTRPSLLKFDSSSQDVCLLPPARIYSEVNEEVSTSKTLMHADSHDKITLRSAGRVLVGSRELSTSQHLRRQCPSGGNICISSCRAELSPHKRKPVKNKTAK